MKMDESVASSSSSSFHHLSIFTNFPLISSVLAFTIAQSIKFLTSWYSERRCDLKRLVGSGGMPSSHSATVTAYALAVGLQEGFGGSHFAIALTLTAIVMYDATGVRLHILIYSIHIYVEQYLKAVLSDEEVYKEAAMEAYPVYNKSHMIFLEMPSRAGDVIVSSYSEITENEYLDPRTAQVAIVDHVKQICTKVRPANDEELPSLYIEEYRSALDAEIQRYVSESYPRGISAVNCVKGKDTEGPGSDFELVVIITAMRLSPQNFCRSGTPELSSSSSPGDLSLRFGN